MLFLDNVAILVSKSPGSGAVTDVSYLGFRENGTNERFEFSSVQLGHSVLSDSLQPMDCHRTLGLPVLTNS